MSDPPYRANVLLVDDRPANLQALVAVLEPLDHNLVLAESGEEALKCLLQQEFAVILLDVLMPGMDGFETAAHIKGREKTRHIPIIFLTAVENDSHHALRGYSEGAVDYIAKPFDPWVLRSKVAVFIELDAKNHTLRNQTEDLFRINAELLRLAEDAQASSRSKGTFLDMAGHELRTPLTVLNGYTALLRSGVFGEMPEAADKPLAIAEAKGEELSALVESILTAAKLESDISPGRAENTELNALVNRAVDRARPRAELMSGRILITRTDGDVFVNIDPRHIDRVLDNLINNALTYGGDHPSVSARVEDEDKPTVSVQDHGIGISVADQERIFGRFIRGGEPALGPPGTGLGLYICRELAERNGGSVVVEQSELCNGSTFVLTLRPGEGPAKKRPARRRAAAPG